MTVPPSTSPAHDESTPSATNDTTSSVVATSTRGRDERGSLARWLLIALSYFVAARALYWNFGWLPTTKIPFSPTGDQVQQVWFLGWLAHAVSHLQNPFFTTSLNFPHGVNLVTNTSSPLLGVLFAPLTWLAGPLATYLALLQLGFALSALSAAVCARRLGANWWASWFVGGVFSFSAIRLVEGTIHVFLAVDVVLPWILFCAIRFWQGRYSARRFGVSVGVLLAADFLISTERVGIEVLILGLVAVLDVVQSRSMARLRAVATGYLTAAVVMLVVLAVPLWYFFFGPQSINGVPHTHVAWGNVSLAQIVQPGPYAWWAPFGRATTAEGLLQGAWNNTGYLGPPLVVLAVVGVIRRRHDALVRGVALVTFIIGVLSLGRSIRLTWVHLSVWSPARLLSVVPGLKDILPFRYGEVVVLGVAWLASQCLSDVTAVTPARRTAYRWVVTILAVATTLSLVPNQILPAGDTGTTPWLATASARASLPEGSAVLTYPYAVTLFNTPMLDQAQSGLWYQLIGGQAIAPGPHGHNVGVRPLEPRVVFDALFRSSQANPRAPLPGFAFAVGPLPPLNATTAAAFRQFVAINHVDEVFWRQWGYHPSLALAYLDGAFGTPTCHAAHTVCVWRTRS